MPTEDTNGGDSASSVDASFASYYLQRSTRELSDDLDTIRNADDFKAVSVPFLVHALQQGAVQFPPEARRQVVLAAKRSESGHR